jgi:type I restriction enzyme, S subunit
MMLKDFVSLQRGFDLPESKRRLGEVPVVGSFGITGYHDTSRVRGPGVTIGRSGASMGVVNYAPMDYWPHNTALFVTDFHGNDQRFAYYFLSSIDFQRYNSGSAQPSLNRNYIYSLPIKVPSRAEQRSIASVLGSLDDKIDLNRRMNETFEEMARALFQSWFVDFDPVRAKMESRQPTGISAEIAALFPHRLENCEIGKAPEGWEVWRVDDVGEVICGKTPSTRVPEYYGDDIPFITIPDMHGKIFATTVRRKLSQAGAASQEKKMLPTGAICVSCIATPGLTVITSEKSHTNQQINTVVPNEPDETYFWYWVLRSLGDEIRAAGSGGSVVTNLSTGRFSKLRVLAPPADLRFYYHSLVGPLFERILANDRESSTLAAIRDALLPKLLSGEIRVGKAVAQVEEVL